MKLSDIKPYDKNAKRHPQKQVEQVANSIKAFGFNQPIVVDANGVIIVGHGRYEAAKLLELNEVPTIQVNLTEEQAKAYRLADNKLNESEWDMNLVIDELKGLSLEMLDLTGFDRDLIIEDDEKDDEIPEDGEFSTFLVDAFKRMAEISKAGAPWYVFHSSSTQDQFREAIEKSGWAIKTQMIWNKPSATMGWADYRMKHEPFFYCGKENTVFDGDRTGTSVWDFQKTEQQLINWAKKQKRAEAEGKTTIWTMKREPVGDYVHPTQKPVELIQHALTNSSKAGDMILDPFLGSGSTLIACEKTGRVCVGLELDPKYADIIIQRYVNFTGNEEIIKNGNKIQWLKN